MPVFLILGLGELRFGNGRRGSSRECRHQPLPVQSWTQRTEERLSGCRASGKTTRGPRVDPEFCARRGTASVANSDTPKAPIDAEPRTVAQPVGESAGR